MKVREKVKGVKGSGVSASRSIDAGGRITVLTRVGKGETVSTSAEKEIIEGGFEPRV